MTLSHVDFERINTLAQLPRPLAPAALDELMRLGYAFTLLVVVRGGYYAPRGYDEKDMIQEGVIGFAQAIDMWNPAKHPKFTAYAWLAVERDIMQWLKWCTRVMRRSHNEAVSLDEPALRDKHHAVDPDGGDRLERWRLPDPSGMARDPGEVLIDDGAGALISALEETMSALELEVFRRCVADDESYLDVARDMGRRPKNIDNACQRVKRKIQARIRLIAQDERMPEDTRMRLARIVHLLDGDSPLEADARPKTTARCAIRNRLRHVPERYRLFCELGHLLPDRYREPMGQFFQGKPVEEIAAAIGLEPNDLGRRIVLDRIRDATGMLRRFGDEATAVEVAAACQASD
jgi:RNA polymerase sporulation-specific sigma factor